MNCRRGDGHDAAHDADHDLQFRNPLHGSLTQHCAETAGEATAMMQLMTQTMALANRAFQPPAPHTMPAANAAAAADGGQILHPAAKTAAGIGASGQNMTTAAADGGEGTEAASPQAGTRKGSAGTAKTAGAAVAAGIAAGGAAGLGFRALLRGKTKGDQECIRVCDSRTLRL